MNALAVAGGEPAMLQPPVKHYLQPGHLFATREPAIITTILGSCISVSLWDTRARFGGMNHFMLPLRAGGTAASPRFGDAAMEQLLDRILALGGKRSFLQARVFGGASMFAAAPIASHLGQKNAEVAIEFLHTRGIDVVEVNVGGDRGRKLIFNTEDGSVCLKTI